MQHPRWKIWLSYLMEVPVASAATALNPSLSLYLRKGRHYLTTKNAVYSYDDLYDNFTDTFRQLDLSKWENADVLILGFGMGSIPYMLEKVFLKSYNYTGIEADEIIAGWAEKYALPNLKSPIELINKDAFEYVAHCDKKFDLIIIDIFLDDEVPSQFEQNEFLVLIKKALKNNGLVLYNRLTDNELGLNKTTAFFRDNFSVVFPGATYLVVGGNWMLVYQ